jgi:hypothetical protein
MAFPRTLARSPSALCTPGAGPSCRPRRRLQTAAAAAVAGASSSSASSSSSRSTGGRFDKVIFSGIQPSGMIHVSLHLLRFAPRSSLIPDPRLDLLPASLLRTRARSSATSWARSTIGVPSRPPSQPRPRFSTRSSASMRSPCRKIQRRSSASGVRCSPRCSRWASAAAAALGERSSSVRTWSVEALGPVQERRLPDGIFSFGDQVPEHTELAWILNCITPLGKLQRMTTWKVSSPPPVKMVAL